MRNTLVFGIVVAALLNPYDARSETLSLSEKSLAALKSAGLADSDRVVVFFNVLQGCPLVEKYQKTLKSIGAQYHQKSVAIFNIDSSVNASRDKTETTRYLARLENPFPLFIDSKARVARELGLKTASESAVVDLKTKTLVFRGPLDDQHRIEFSRPRATKHYVTDAIDRALSADKKSTSGPAEIIVPFGCIINLDPP